jgi:hypothetical protein
MGCHHARGPLEDLRIPFRPCGLPALYGAEGRHRKCNYHINFVGQLFLRDLPSTGALDCDTAADCQAHLGIWVQDQGPCLITSKRLVDDSVSRGTLCANSTIGKPAAVRR